MTMMGLRSAVFGCRLTTKLARCLPVVLQDSASSCFTITPANTRQIHHKNSLQALSHTLSSRIPVVSGLLNNRKNNDNKSIFRNNSTSSSSSDDKGFLVYEGRVKGLLRKVKFFSLGTSVIGLAVQPYLWYTVQDMSLVIAAPLFTAVNFFVFANPLLIHYLAKRYVNELYYNPRTKTYTATLLTIIGRKKSLSYTAEDVVVPEIPGLFSMLTAKGRPIFVDHSDFTSIEVYKHMMGFDKPLDLTYVADSSEKKEE